MITFSICNKVTWEAGYWEVKLDLGSEQAQKWYHVSFVTMTIVLPYGLDL